MNEIRFLGLDKRVNILNRKKAKLLFEQIFLVEKKLLHQLFFIFCSDDYLLQINKKFLKHDHYTDTISFLLSKNKKPVEGEIYLSIDRIKENAKTYAVSYQNELLRVMIHSILHLCGYRDDTIISKKKMHKKEDFYLKLYKNSRET